jgi:hypothetical protein
VVGRQELVASIQSQRTQDGVRACGRIGYECEVVRIGANERPKDGARPIQGRFQLAGEETDGLRLHPFAPCLLRGQHGSWSGPERAVIEERDGRIQGPVLGELGRHRGLS